MCASSRALNGNSELRETCDLLDGWSGLLGNGQCSHWTQGAGHFRAAREAQPAEARGQSKRSHDCCISTSLVRTTTSISPARAHRITKFLFKICNAAPHRPNCGGAAFRSWNLRSSYRGDSVSLPWLLQIVLRWVDSLRKVAVPNATVRILHLYTFVLHCSSAND